MSVSTLKMYYGSSDKSRQLGMVRLTPEQTHSMDVPPTPMKGLYSIVIDNSGSMNSAATTVNDDGDKVDHGWSLLDITKHSTSTFIMSMGDDDYISLTVYSSTATVMAGWTKCTSYGRDLLMDIVKGIRIDGATNMVAGLTKGLEQFRVPPQEVKPEEYNSVLIFTTDGIPTNCYHPVRGIPGYKLLVNNFLKSHDGYISVYTVGLGSQLNSMLLTDICCNTGEFLHLSDPGCVGPFMVNLVAQCRSVSCLPGSKEPSTNMWLRLEGNVVEVPGYEGMLGNMEGDVIVPLRTVLHDIPRDVAFTYTGEVRVALYHSGRGGQLVRVETMCDTSENGNLDVELQWIRQSVVKYLMTIHGSDSWRETLRTPIDNIVDELVGHREVMGINPALDDIWKTLVNELTLGLSTSQNFTGWGRHYMRSLEGNLRRGVRTNFRDFILQRYSLDARGEPGFFDVECEKSEEIFSRLPAPTPSLIDSIRASPTPLLHTILPDEFMRGGGCFAPECTVDRWNGAEFETIAMGDVRPHDELRTARGKAEVRCVVKTMCPGGRAEVVRLGGLRLTAWHPVWLGRMGKWVFPCTLGTKVVEHCEWVYNFVMHIDPVVEVSGTYVVTLGHQMMGPVVQHSYWGIEVISDLEKKLGWASGYVVLQEPLQPPKAPRGGHIKANNLYKIIREVKLS